MSSEVCKSCRRPKAVSHCQVCEEAICKGCTQFLDASAFSFLKDLPEVLSHTFYCAPCFDTHVGPALTQYEETMELARKAYFFFNTQKRLLPVLKRAKEVVRVDACEDRNETILRLAFRAVEGGFNSIIEAEVGSKKVRNEGYEKSVWSGVGVPALVDSAKLERAASRGE